MSSEWKYPKNTFCANGQRGNNISCESNTIVDAIIWNPFNMFYIKLSINQRKHTYSDKLPWFAKHRKSDALSAFQNVASTDVESKPNLAIHFKRKNKTLSTRRCQWFDAQHVKHMEIHLPGKRIVFAPKSCSRKAASFNSSMHLVSGNSSESRAARWTMHLPAPISSVRRADCLLPRFVIAGSR